MTCVIETRPPDGPWREWGSYSCPVLARFAASNLANSLGAGRVRVVLGHSALQRMVRGAVHVARRA